MQMRCPLSHARFCPAIISDVWGLVPMDGLVLLVVLGCCYLRLRYCCFLLGHISLWAIDGCLGSFVDPSVALPGDGMVWRRGLDLSGSYLHLDCQHVVH